MKRGCRLLSVSRLLIGGILLIPIGCGSRQATEPAAPTTLPTAPQHTSRSNALSDDVGGEVLPNAMTPISDANDDHIGSPYASSRPIATDSYRLPDDRPLIDESKLEGEGIRMLRSRRLVLLTDAPADQVAHIPELADLLFEELERQLGPLRPARDGNEFQVTGMVMNSDERFRTAGLLPETGFTIRHGRHQGYRFWMRNPPTDYYRRHLSLHEFVHCFQMCEHGMRDIPPLWYTEGIAEFFATHVVTTRDNRITRAEFGILPAAVDAFDGWGRISEIKRSFDRNPSLPPANSGLTSLDAVLYPATTEFVEDLQYAQAWAACWFFRNHPQLENLRPVFSQARTSADFREAFARIEERQLAELRTDWLLFQDSLTEGFDAKGSIANRSAGAARDVWGSASRDISVTHDTEKKPPVMTTVAVQAESEWTLAVAGLTTGQVIGIEAAGQFQMAREPRPWISEPQGITIDYHRGRPLGELAAILIASDGGQATRRIPVGRSHEFAMPFDGELWLQLNDSSARRSDNSGAASVTIRIAR